jgi:ligand-binding SRPBCC domain-containing protein
VAESLDAMTTLNNAVHIDAPPEKVWAVLAQLEALQDYDPAISKSKLEAGETTGPGASRRCELKEGGWFRERVTVWEPQRALAFELHDCSLPVNRLRHHYTLGARGAGTVVEQRMDYKLKFGPLGAVLDAILVRRRWDKGIKAFLAGLKKHVEAAPSS